MHYKGTPRPSSISHKIKNNNIIRKIEHCYPSKEYEGTELDLGTSIFEIDMSKLSPRQVYKILGHVSNSQPTKVSSRPQTHKYIVNYG